MWKQLIMGAWLGVAASFSMITSADDTADMVGTIDDEPYSWFVLRQGGDSNASFIEIGDQLSIDITGYIDPTEWDAQEALAMSFMVEQGTLIDAKVMHLIGETAMPPLYTSEGGDVQVNLSRIERDGSVLHISGQLEGWLALQRTLDTVPNSEDSIPISVCFNVAAQKVEF